MKTCLLIARFAAACFLFESKLLAANDIVPPDTNRASLFVGAYEVSWFYGTNYASEVRWLDVKDLPRWNDDGKLPLSIKDATSRANVYLKNYFASSGIKGWQLSRVVLRRWWWDDVWFYELYMTPEINSTGLSEVAVFVTLSGHVCPLRELPK